MLSSASTHVTAAVRNHGCRGGGAAAGGAGREGYIISND